MTAALSTSARFDIQDLARAMALSHALDAMPMNLGPEQWKALADYLQPIQMQAGQTLIEQGTKERMVYLVESGNLTVHYEDAKERIRLAMVGPGSVLGEGAFFSHLPRSATVSVSNPSRLWCLTPLRFRELSTRHPDVALELVMGMSAVLARRMYNRPKRIAVT